MDDEALALAEQAAANNRSAETLNTLGNARARRGDVDGAERAYRDAIQFDGAFFKPYGNLATLLATRGKRRDAVALFQRALSLNPDSFRFHTNLGNALRDLGQSGQAIESFRRSIAIEPSHAALHNLACVLVLNGDWAEAVARFQQALELDGNAFETHVELALAYDHLERRNDAQSHLRAAIELGPSGGRLDLGATIERIATLEDLLVEVAARHHVATPALSAVRRYAKRGDIVAAVALAETVVTAFPGDPKGWIELAAILARDMDDGTRAAAVLERAWNATARADELVVPIALFVTAARGDAQKALEDIHALFARIDVDPEVRRATLLLMHNSEGGSAEGIYREHTNWASQLPSVPQVGTARCKPRGRLRIGYLSADFRRHSVAKFIEPVLREHDRRRFEIFCYSSAIQEDAVTRRLKALPVQWRRVGALDDIAVARKIASDEIDVLIDLGGHTQGSRLTVLRHRPAPVQMSYLGYPGTTGLSEVDFRIADEWVEPRGEADRWSSERILRPSKSAWCFEPPKDALLETRRSHGPPTLASFNALKKISAATLDAWAKILARLPAARFVIKTAFARDAPAEARLRDAFSRRGVSPDRIGLLPFLLEEADHLSVYCGVDVALDTFPYNGTTTTCEALWMGVPVVTLAGNTPASRVGVSLLGTVGLSDLVTHDWDEYVDVAVRLIRNGERLQHERSTLRRRISASALGDARQFVRDLEAVYEATVGSGRSP